MENLEIYLITKDDNRISVSSKDEVKQHLKTNQDISAISVKGFVPYIELDDAWGTLVFGDLDIYMITEYSQGSFEFQLYEVFMRYIRNNFEAGAKNEFETIMSYPKVNNDDLIQIDPLYVTFKDLENNRIINSSEFEEEIEEDDYFDY